MQKLHTAPRECRKWMLKYSPAHISTVHETLCYIYAPAAVVYPLMYVARTCSPSQFHPADNLLVICQPPLGLHKMHGYINPKSIENARLWSMHFQNSQSVQSLISSANRGAQFLHLQDCQKTDNAIINTEVWYKTPKHCCILTQRGHLSRTKDHFKPVSKPWLLIKGLIRYICALTFWIGSH